MRPGVLDSTVRQVAGEFIKLKEREGEVGALHLCDLRNRGARFANAFECPISGMRPEDICDYVLEQDVSLRTGADNTVFD